MTAETHQQQDERVCLPRTDVESRREPAACRVERKALKDVGREDEEAANNLRTLRDRAGPLNPMPRPILHTVVRGFTRGVLTRPVAGVAANIGPYTPNERRTTQ